MDIQEIREGVWQILHDHKKEDEWSGVVIDIFSYLAEKDACFPVEGELPNNPFYTYESFGYSNAQQDMLKANYKKVITLKEMLGGD